MLWFTVELARGLVTNPPDAARLQDALAGDDRPVDRVYTNRPYAVIAQRTL